MGELVNNLGNMAAFQNQIYPNGLDLGRCVYQQDIGVLAADPTATFYAGMLVTRFSSTGLIQTSTGTDFFGVAKWNKANQWYGTAIDEPQVMTGTTATNLNHSNLWGTNSNPGLKVAATANATTSYTLTTDYTVNVVNGTITRAGGSTIPSGSTVYVTYSWQLSNTDLQFEGRNFWNFTDDVTIQDGRIAIITDWSILFTTQYDHSQIYTTNGLTSNLYAAGASVSTNAGLFTSNTTDGGAFVGRVMQAPSAGDPYLGVVFSANPIQFQTGPSAGGVGQITA